MTELLDHGSVREEDRSPAGMEASGRFSHRLGLAAMRRLFLRSERHEPTSETLHERLFVPDDEAEPPELLQDVAFCRLENLLKELPAAIKRKEARVDVLGSGIESIVLRLREGDADLAVKLFTAEMPEDVFAKVAKLASFSKKDILRTEVSRRHFAKQAAANMTPTSVLQNAGGAALGHAVAPDHIDAPVNILTYNGQPIGITMRTVEGRSTNVHLLADEGKAVSREIHEVQRRLRENGILYDNMGRGNVIVSETDDSFKIIDTRVNVNLLGQGLSEAIPS